MEPDFLQDPFLQNNQEFPFRKLEDLLPSTLPLEIWKGRWGKAKERIPAEPQGKVSHVGFHKHISWLGAQLLKYAVNAYLTGFLSHF